MYSDTYITCPQCRRLLVYEWVPRIGAGWCVICGYYEYYASYQAFLESLSEGDAGV
jgi:hypothetical protein